MLKTKKQIVVLEIKTLYEILIDKKSSRTYMENIWRKEFRFHIDTNLWKDIYIRSFITLLDKILREFKFKLLHGLIICNNKLVKWQLESSDLCHMCNLKQNGKHSLIGCYQVHHMWKHIGRILRLNIQWKHLVL